MDGECSHQAAPRVTILSSSPGVFPNSMNFVSKSKERE
jgi:hypothetical protein